MILLNFALDLCVKLWYCCVSGGAIQHENDCNFKETVGRLTSAVGNAYVEAGMRIGAKIAVALLEE